jgi:hypothetical protein
MIFNVFLGAFSKLEIFSISLYLLFVAVLAFIINH